MHTIDKSIEIHAPKSKVGFVLTDPKMTAIWCSEFMPGSYMEGEWKEGGTVRYLDGSNQGLRGTVTHYNPESMLRVEYNAEITNGVEYTDSEEAKKWVGTYDEWHLSEENGVTTLRLESKAPKEYYEDFLEMWDITLEKVKELAESN